MMMSPQHHSFPVRIFSQYVQLVREHINALFGQDYELTPIAPSGTGELFICAETVHFRTSMGRIEDLRIIGPATEETSICVTQNRFLSLYPTEDKRGEESGSRGGILEGKTGTVVLADGVQPCKRHLSLVPEDAEQLSLSEDSRVNLQIIGPMNRTMHHVPVLIESSGCSQLFIEPEEATTLILDDTTIAKILV
jgi:putative phosphotransacetylase